MIETTALIEARRGVRIEDERRCLTAWERLHARYGHEAASAAWLQACREMDAEAEGTGR